MTDTGTMQKPAGGTPFVGRTAELALLDEALSALERGEARAESVAGPAGKEYADHRAPGPRSVVGGAEDLGIVATRFERGCH